MREPDPNKSIFSPHKWDADSPQAKLQALVFAIVFTAPLVLLDTYAKEDPNCTELTALDGPCGPLDTKTEAEMNKIFDGGRNCNGSTGPKCEPEDDK